MLKCIQVTNDHSHPAVPESGEIIYNKPAMIFTMLLPAAVLPTVKVV
jgi:hypothetical protein